MKSLFIKTAVFWLASGVSVGVLLFSASRLMSDRLHAAGVVVDQTMIADDLGKPVFAREEISGHHPGMPNTQEPDTQDMSLEITVNLRIDEQGALILGGSSVPGSVVVLSSEEAGWSSRTVADHEGSWAIGFAREGQGYTGVREFHLSVHGNEFQRSGGNSWAGLLVHTGQNDPFALLQPNRGGRETTPAADVSPRTGRWVLLIPAHEKKDPDPSGNSHAVQMAPCCDLEPIPSDLPRAQEFPDPGVSHVVASGYYTVGSTAQIRFNDQYVASITVGDDGYWVLRNSVEPVGSAYAVCVEYTSQESGQFPQDENLSGNPERISPVNPKFCLRFGKEPQMTHEPVSQESERNAIYQMP